MGRMSGSNLTKVKRQNNTYIKEIIYKYGPISRSEIADMLSLTPPTITTNVNELIANGLIRELQGADSNREDCSVGRKPVKIDFVPSARFFVGAELAPEKTLICLTDLRANIIARRAIKREVTEYDTAVACLPGWIEDVIRESDVDRAKIMGACVAVPGFVDSNHGVIRRQRHQGWENRPFAGDLNKKLGFPVRVDNNVRVRAIGEDLISSKVRPETFIYFFVSKGIACSLMIKNSIFTGQAAGAGEVGHMIVEIDGAKCETCGNNGCLEAYSSDVSIIRRCATAIRNGADTILKTLAADPANPTLDEILAAQGCEDRVVGSIMQSSIRYLAISLANIVNFISPQLVIIDAYIMKSAQNRELLLEQVKKNLYGLNETEVEIEFKPFDEMSGAQGAAAAAIKYFFIREG